MDFGKDDLQPRISLRKKVEATLPEDLPSWFKTFAFITACIIVAALTVSATVLVGKIVWVILTA
jgi:hypothetical protein